MARLFLGSDTTNEKGIANIDYTGTGVGKTYFIAKDGSLTGENELIDALFIGTKRTDGWYATTVSLIDGHLKWIYDSTNAQYVGIRGTVLNKTIGKTVTTTVKIQSDKAVGFAVYYQIDGEWVNANYMVIRDTLEHSLSATIPKNATNVWFRLHNSQSSLQNGDIVYVDKWETYLEHTHQHYPAIELSNTPLIIGDGDDATITGRLRNVLGELLPSKTVSFYEDNELFDTQTSDNNGLVSTEITGEGLGARHISARVGNVVSEPFYIMDCIKYDIGTTTQHTDIWTQSLDYLSRNAYYSILTDPTTTRLTYATITGDIAIEFDAKVGYSSLRFVTIRTGSTTHLGTSLNTMGLDTDEWYHYKIELRNGECTITNTTNDNVVTGSATGFNRIYFGAEGGSYISFRNFAVYSLSNDTPTPTPSSITLSSNKSILSAYDSETATLTATVEDTNSQGVSGLDVGIYKGNVKIGDALDNGDGTYTYTYNSNGIGDLSLTAQCEGLTSSAVNIEDCLYYKAEEVSYVSTYTSGDHSIRLDNNLSIPITTDFEFSMDCKSNINGSRLQLSSISGASSSTTNYGFGFNRDGTAMNVYYRTTSSNAWGSSIAYDTNYHNVKFVRSGDTFTGYLDNTSKGTQTFTWWDSKSPFSLYWWVWRNGTITAKNIKIKPL